MSFFAAVYKKDFRSLFRSPAAFAYLTVFTLLSGIFYYRGFLYFSSVCAEAPRGMVLNVNEAVFTPLHSNMVLLIVLLVPLLTMRLLAEERRSGTLELLRSYPSSGAGLVAAKFLSALIVFSLGLAATFLFPVYTLAFGRVDWGPILTALLGLLLGGAFLVSIGLLFSSITDNQIIAALSSMGTSLLFWILGWLGRYLPSRLAGFIAAFSLHDRLLDAFRGVLNTGDVVFFMVFALAALGMTGIVIGSRGSARIIRCILLFAAAVVAQDLGSRLVVRLDATARKIHSLAPITKKALSGLDGSPLELTVFMEDDEDGRSDLEALLAMYRAEYPGLKPSFFSPSRNPALVQRFGIGSHGVLVLRYRNEDLKVSGYDEESITGGILKLLHPRNPVVYFLSGHGEKTQSRDLRALSFKLEEQGYSFRDLSLQKTPEIPKDASCLVAAGPRESYLGPEFDLIKDYIRRGGGLLLLLDPYYDGGFASLLSPLGIGLGKDAVVDEGAKLFRGDSLFPRVFDYPSHAITLGLDRVAMFPVARSLTLAPKNDKIDLSAIALSSEKAWAETDRASLSGERAAFDPAADRAGPLVLAAAAKLRAEDPKLDGRIVVIGDSDFVSDAYLSTAGNAAFFLNSLAWLTASEEKIGLVLREPGHHPIVLSENQALLTGFIALALVPGVFAVGGIRVLLRRRKEN